MPQPHNPSTPHLQHPGRRHRRGAAMLLVILAIAVATILGLSFLRSSAPTLAVANNIDRQARARAIAETGLTYAIQYVKDNTDWRSTQANGLWIADVDYAGGTFSVYGTDADGDLADDTTDHLVLEAVGTFDGVTHRATTRIQQEPPVGVRLLLIVPNAASPGAQDAAKKALFESWDYQVTLLQDDATTPQYTAAIDNTDVVYVSEESNSSYVDTRLNAATVGVVNEQHELQKVLSMANGAVASSSTETAIRVSDNSHYITRAFQTGDLTIAQPATDLTSTSATLASGVQTLAQGVDGAANPALMVADADGALHSGTAPGRRVMLPFGNAFDINDLTADGQTLVRRALEWASLPVWVDGARLLAAYEFDLETSHPRLVGHWRLDEPHGSGGGIAAYDQVALSNNALIDSYASLHGGYNTTNQYPLAAVSTNNTGSSQIRLTDNALLEGNAFVEPSSNPATGIYVSPTAQLTGDKLAAPYPQWLPLMYVPAGLPSSSGALSFSSGTVVINSDATYDSISMDGDAVLEIQGDCTVHIEQSFWISGNCQLVLAPGASLELWVGQELFVRNDAQLNNAPSRTQDLEVYLYRDASPHGLSFKMFHNTTFAGTVYCDDNVELIDNANFYGQIMASQHISILNNAQAHNDLTLDSLGAAKPHAIDSAGGNHGTYGGGPPAQAYFGPYTFNNHAFATRVVSNDGNIHHFNGDATTLEEALLGFSPANGLINIGDPNPAEGGALNSNDFTLYFDDFAAIDGAGADIVLFDSRFSTDPFEIAVISGGTQSAFLTINPIDQVNTGERPEILNSSDADIFGLEIDLADYGVPDAQAIRFRSLLNTTGRTEGDPRFAGVLNGIPTPGSLARQNLVGDTPTLGGPKPPALVTSGTSASFDSGPDHVMVEHSDEYLLKEGTVSLWFKIDNHANFHTLFCKDTDFKGDFAIYTTGTGALVVTFDSTHSLTHTGLIEGQWHHAAVSFGPEGLALYLDGVLVDTNTYTGGLHDVNPYHGFTNLFPITLGARDSTSIAGWNQSNLAYYLQGDLDDVRIYDAWCDASQVAEIMVGGAPSPRAKTTQVRDLSGYDDTLDLIVDDPAQVTWGSGTLTFDASAVAQSADDATKIHDAIELAGQFSVVAQVQRGNPASTTGPANIVSISDTLLARNVTLAQEGSALDVRTRTTDTGSNGELSPNFQAAAALNDDTFTNVAVTYDGTTLRAYINGVLQHSQALGGVMNWAAAMPLLVGNERTGNRPWLGTIDSLLIYDGALTSDEITDLMQRSLLGPSTGIFRMDWDEPE